MRVRFKVYGEDADALESAAYRTLLNFGGSKWDFNMEVSPAVETLQADPVSWVGDVEAWRSEARTVNLP